MGWSEYRACHYKNGKIDRKAELLDEFSRSNYQVLKCSMVGSTGYMAVMHPKGHIFGLVCLTSTRDNRWFGYKLMGEETLPYCYDCPKVILDMLSPTDDKLANEWRSKCRRGA